MVTFDVEVEIPMDAEAYLREKDSQAYKDFHMRKMGTLEQEYLSHEVVDGHVVTVTRTVPSINIPWALRRAILGNKQAEFIDRRRWMEGTHLTAPFTQSFHTTNNITDRCVVEGTITVEPAGAAGACRVRAQGEGRHSQGFRIGGISSSPTSGVPQLPEVMESGSRQTPRDAAASSFVSNLSPAAPHRARRRGGAFGSFIDVESAADVVAFDDEDEDVDAKSPAMKRGRRSSSSRFRSWSRATFVSSFASSVPRDRGRSLLRPGGRVARRRRRRRPRAAVYGFALFAVFAAATTIWYLASFVARVGVPARASPVDLGSLRAKHRPDALAAELNVLERAAAATTDVEASRNEAISRARERAERVAATKATKTGTGTVASGSTSACVDARPDDCEAWACRGRGEPGVHAGDVRVRVRGGGEQRAAGTVPGGPGWADPSRGLAGVTADGSPREDASDSVRRDDAPVVVGLCARRFARGRALPGRRAARRVICTDRSLRTGWCRVLVGVGRAGVRSGRGRRKATWRRGTVGYIPGGDNLLIATKDHPGGTRASRPSGRCGRRTCAWWTNGPRSRRNRSRTRSSRR